MTIIRTSFDPSGVKASLAEFGAPTGDTADGDVNISGEFKINGVAIGDGGNVSSQGTPAPGQLALWTSAADIQGVDFATAMNTYLSGLPTTDPGDGTPWLNGGFLFKGTL